MANINAKLKTRAEATAVPVTNGNLFLFFDADNAGVLTVKDHNNVFTPVGGSGSSAGGETFFEFPAASGVTEADIGKLMMNDGSLEMGSPVAKVYEYSPSSPETVSQWQIKIYSVPERGEFGNFSAVQIEDENGLTYKTVSEWEDQFPPTDPNDTQSSAEAFLAFLQATFPNLTCTGSWDGNGGFYLINVSENSFLHTSIQLYNWNSQVNQISSGHAEIPPAPAGYPLGKLLGFTSGGMCKISNNIIEEYQLHGDFDLIIDNKVFDARFDMYKDATPPITNFSDVDTYLPFIVVGAPGGKIRPFDFSLMAIDLLNENFSLGELNAVYRHQVVGLAMKSGNGGEKIPVIRFGALNVLFKPAISTIDFFFKQ